jgi:hypothetical protein
MSFNLRPIILKWEWEVENSGAGDGWQWGKKILLVDSGQGF